MAKYKNVPTDVMRQVRLSDIQMTANRNVKTLYGRTIMELDKKGRRVQEPAK